jgi:peptide/nickel transport system permease protein
VVALACAVGVTIGMISGFAGGWLDWFIMRLADAMLSFPSLVLAIALAAAFGPSLENAMLAVAITLMPQFARVARGQAVSVSVKPYVEAAVTLGLPQGRILLRYVFANGVGPLLVQATLALGAAILQTASLGFLGLGITPDTGAEWGYDLSLAVGDLLVGAWWTALFPSIALVSLVLGFSLIAEWSAEDSLRRKRETQ